MKKKKIDLVEYIENNTVRMEASRRGGGIEIELDPLLKTTAGLRMTAYQNYLGGGMLGAVQSSQNFEIDKVKKTDHKKVEEIREALKKYFHAITNEEAGEYDEWNASGYEANQSRPASAY